MDRRTVLKGAGSALLAGTAGCTRQVTGGTPYQTSEDATKSPAEIIRQVNLSGKDHLPNDVDLAIDADVVESTVTQDQTAVVRITFTNTGSKQVFTFGALPPFTVTDSVETKPGILLLNPETSVEMIRSECWQPPRSSHAGSYNAIAKIITLDSGESVSRKAEIWGSELNETDECLPTGTFRFEREYRFGFADIPSFTWGFSVSLTTP